MSHRPRLERLMLAIPLVCSLSWTARPHAGDWAGWRGPRHDGTTTGARALAAEHVGMEVLWRRPLGSGYSGIAVSAGRAVTQYSDGSADWLTALDAVTGDERWRVRLDDVYVGHDGSDDGPSATPVIAGDTAYGLSAQGRLIAVSLTDGALRWERNLADGLGATPSSFGFASTPLVVDDLVVVAVGGEQGAFTAFDRRTGQVRWRAGSDRVEYQSPLVTTLLGRRTLLTLGNDLLLGLDPETGAEWWRLDYGPRDRYSTTAVVPVAGDRLLINPWPDTAMFVAREDGGTVVFDELWREKTLDARLSTSVVHNDHVYGFDGRFLSCVDAATGKKVWKSRPPGGGAGLILVDDHLLTVGSDGDLVLVRASPAGYEERARVSALSDAGATYPSFADGVAFVRNTEEIAAVAIRAVDRPPATSTQSGLHGVLAQLGRRLERSDTPGLVVNSFLAEADRPLVDPAGWVHFLWRGAADDVGLQSSQHGWDEVPLARLGETDLWYRSERLPAGVRLEYRFNIDFDNVGPDPANPRRVPAEWGADYSVLSLPDHPDPVWLGAYSGDRPGTLRQASERILDREREVTFWIPDGHRADGTASLLVVLEGPSWQEKGWLLDVLRHRVGIDTPPMVVAFVDAQPEELSGEGHAAFLSVLATEAVPRWVRDHGLSVDRRDRAILGRWRGAYAAVVAGLNHPDVFGQVAATSYLARDDLPALLSRITTGPRNDVRFHVAWNRYERWDADEMSRDLHRALLEAGYTVDGGQREDSAGWGGWRAWAGEILPELFGGVRP